MVEFGPFRLDRAGERLYWRDRPVRLRPKAFAVLAYLAARPQRLVTRHELLAAVWPDVSVSESTLTGCVREIRHTLRDPHGRPRYIETVPRRGYRFIALEADEPSPATGPAPLVGRDEALARLTAAFARARDGARTVALVRGEAGIGKTSLVEHFVAAARSRHDVEVATGQCVDGGAGEPFLPVLEAIGRLCRDAGDDRTAEALRRHAPHWAEQLPGLARPTNGAAPPRLRGRERLLGELGSALEVLTTDRPLLLVLEDLHWSDPSTLDLVALLARRRSAARLLLIATLRDGDATTPQRVESLARELIARTDAVEIALDRLDERAVSAYLGLAAGTSAPASLVGWLARRTGGNPFFLVETVARLRDEGALALGDGRCEMTGLLDAFDADLPGGVRPFLDKQVDALDAGDARLLEAASASGQQFSAAEVAAAGQHELIAVEDRLEALARRGVIVEGAGVAEWPDGTLCGRYRFLHALYRDALYARLGPARRVETHARIGRRLESGRRDEADTIANTLALHFELGRDGPRAARYHTLAAEHALRRSAPEEAIESARAGLRHTTQLERTKRDETELRLQLVLGGALTPLRGLGAAETATAFERALELCRRLDDTHHLAPALWGHAACHSMRADMRAARRIVSELLEHSQRGRDDGFEIVALNGLANLSYYMGDFAGCRASAQQVLERYEPSRHRGNTGYFGLDLGVNAAAIAALNEWHFCDPAASAERTAQAVALAQAVDDPYSLAHAHAFGAIACSLFGDAATAAHAERADAIAREHGFPLWAGVARFARAWSQPPSPDTLAEMAAAVATIEKTGTMGLTYFRLGMARNALLGGNPARARELAQAGLALAEHSGERNAEPALRLVHSLVQPGDAAEAGIRAALELARALGSLALELQCAGFLAQRLVATDRGSEAGRLLAPVLARVPSAFQTGDARLARALLESNPP